MSYTRFLVPEPIHTFNASHTDKEIRAWQAEQIAEKVAETTMKLIDQLNLPLEPANAQPASTTDFEKNSAQSEQPMELDLTQFP
jgi:hypothetical protein